MQGRQRGAIYPRHAEYLPREEGLLKLLTIILLFASIPPIRIAPTAPKPLTIAARKENRGGRWYMSDDGHAVFCYGPAMYLQSGNGIIRVATFCRGDKTIVKLHE
jgi:hypothetical protein